MVSKKTIELSDNDIRLKKTRLDTAKIDVKQLEISLLELEERLKENVDMELAQEKLELIKKHIKDGKDETGREFTPAELKKLKINQKVQEKFVNEELPKELVRIQIRNAQNQIEQKQLGVIRPLEKQIRERNIVVTE